VTSLLNTRATKSLYKEKMGQNFKKSVLTLRQPTPPYLKIMHRLPLSPMAAC